MSGGIGRLLHGNCWVVSAILVREAQLDGEIGVRRVVTVGGLGLVPIEIKARK